MSTSNNLLVALSKWASGQQENFLSDAFVHLLTLLGQEAPDAFAAIIAQLSLNTIRPTWETAGQFVITTQVSTSQGTPDVEIIGPDTYALIEVKDESPADLGQLKRYLRVIDRKRADSKCLIFLTRHQPLISETSERLKLVRWTQVSKWLKVIENTSRLKPVPRAATKEFIDFLEAKGMAVNRAGWEMPAGLQQFSNFKVLLKEATASVGVPYGWTAYGGDFNGWTIADASRNKAMCYLFVRFKEPETLVFHCNGTNIFDEYKPLWNRRTGGSKGWLERYMDLGSEEVHFFARSLDSQMAALESFISSCLEQTKAWPSLKKAPQR